MTCKYQEAFKKLEETYIEVDRKIIVYYASSKEL